ncbi:hypothetical protein LCGC14_1521570 [marine sediment metagenome]|uniref:Uncharacterized protein n=1 Tax=marine sediment metagenome TaxID=412755 RepID=A0A0F9IYH7_9ZZZZ
MRTSEERLKRAAWKKTPAGKACEKRYARSPAGKAATKRKNAAPTTKLRKSTWQKEYGLERARKRNAHHRLVIIEFYGGKCLDCGIEDHEVLSLDHLGGGGQGHRKEVSHGRIEGRGVYHWVWKFVKNSETPPVKLELVCRNCNWKRHLVQLRKDMQYEEHMGTKQSDSEVAKGNQGKSVRSDSD